MEAEFVEWLSQQIPPRDSVPLGVGDDAAVVRMGASELVVTTDLICDGTHFQLEQTAPQLVGRKALAVNLSDLAAMAARPHSAVVSVVWPRELSLVTAQAIYQGLLDLAAEYDVALVGGDTNRWNGRLVLSVALMGVPTPRGVLTRRGAQPGDAVIVTGRLGGSLLGHHLTFEPRVREALELHQNYTLHAGMDLTDGLSLDLDRLTRASRVGAELTLSDIPLSDAAWTVSRQTGRDPVDHALADGEDFELLLTLAADEADRLLSDRSAGSLEMTRVGTIVDQPGLWQRTADGRRVSLPVRGYLH